MPRKARSKRGSNRLSPGRSVASDHSGSSLNHGSINQAAMSHANVSRVTGCKPSAAFRQRPAPSASNVPEASGAAGGAPTNQEPGAGGSPTGAAAGGPANLPNAVHVGNGGPNHRTAKSEKSAAGILLSLSSGYMGNEPINGGAASQGGR